MADRTECDLDAALARLAMAERIAAPRPGPALSARVLADAAAVSAQAQRPAVPSKRTGSRRWRFGLVDWFLAPGGAAAALALSLVLGLGLGYGVGAPFVVEDAALEGVAALGGLDDFMLVAAVF